MRGRLIGEEEVKQDPKEWERIDKEHPSEFVNPLALGVHDVDVDQSVQNKKDDHENGHGLFVGEDVGEIKDPPDHQSEFGDQKQNDDELRQELG